MLQKIVKEFLTETEYNKILKCNLNFLLSIQKYFTMLKAFY